MAELAVNELLHDPDFVDDMQLIVRTTAVDSLGQNVISEKCTNTIGCVQPASGSALARAPDALRFADTSSFWIEGVIPVTGPGQYPAILTFRGIRYQVQKIFDFTNFGPGYTEGLCVVERPA